MPLDVIVLAAGQGKRMRSDLPKVLHPLAGGPLLAHVLDTARALEPRRIVVVHGHGGEQVRAAFAALEVDWVVQAEQLGTAHAVRQALPRLGEDGDVLILYGDVPLVRPASLKRLVEAAREGMAVMTAEMDDPTGYGRVQRGPAGDVERIVEEKDASSAERAVREVNAGFMALGARRLREWLAKIGNRNAQKEYYLTDLVGLAVGEGVPVAAVKVQDATEVAGVNSKRELAALERVLQREQAGRLMDEGVTLADPARLDVRGTLQCGRDVSIGEECEVHAFSHLDDSQIGARCRLGPYARLRPGSALAEEVHIGNFVEVKASRLAAGAKANHLTYIGDAEVGARTNVGAGTITCNYDGVAKHRTVIEDDCFIGSDATLVAPVRIARGSYIGAGSTITRDTPAGQLTVGRARQASIPGWKPPKKRG